MFRVRQYQDKQTVNINLLSGVVHLGQIQSGLRAAIRIVQGSHIKIHMNSDIPVQVLLIFFLSNININFSSLKG